MESPTFVSIIDEIIKDFYIKYMTVGSLQKITEILDPSKYPEYEEYICVINKTIKELKQRGYTKFFKKELTPDITMIMATRSQTSPPTAAIQTDKNFR